MRDSYLAKWRKIVANDEITKKVIVHEGKVVGSVGAFVVDGDTEVSYWIRRDLWGRGRAAAALAELLSVVTVRLLWARAAARGSRKSSTGSTNPPTSSSLPLAALDEHAPE